MESIYIALATIPGLAALVWLVLFAYPEYRIEQFRQDLFILRDTMFDEAARGKLVDFDHPAYGMLRTTMNGYLRFAHTMSLTEVALLMGFMERTGLADSFSKEFDEVSQSLPTPIIEKLNSYRQRMQHVVLRRIMFGSIFSTIFFVILILPRLAYALFSSILKRTRGYSVYDQRELQTKIKELDPVAYDYGQLAPS